MLKIDIIFVILRFKLQDQQLHFKGTFCFSEENATPRNHGGSLYNGDSQVLYWADASSEIAFVVPTRCHEHDALPQFDTSSESTHLSGQGKLVLNVQLLY